MTDRHKQLISYLLNYDLYLDKLTLLLFLCDTSYLLLKSYTKPITTYTFFKNNEGSIKCNQLITDLNQLSKDKELIIRKIHDKYYKLQRINRENIQLTLFNDNEKNIIDTVIDRFLTLNTDMIKTTVYDFQFYKSTPLTAPFDHDILRKDELFKTHIQIYLNRNHKETLISF
jgi:hypothetical protein